MNSGRRGAGGHSRSMGTSRAPSPPPPSRPPPPNLPQRRQSPPPEKPPPAGNKQASRPSSEGRQGPSAAGTFGASAAGAAVGTMVGSALGSAMTRSASGGGVEAGSPADIYGSCADQLYSLLECAQRRRGNLDACGAAMDDLMNCHTSK